MKIKQGITRLKARNRQSQGNYLNTEIIACGTDLHCLKDFATSPNKNSRKVQTISTLRQ